EKILDLFESLTGSRMMCNYMRFGGCRVELPAGWLEQTKKVVEEFPRFLDEYEQLLTVNEIFMARAQGVGVLKRDLAINAGVTGPMLRASGVNYDIQKWINMESMTASTSKFRWVGTVMSTIATWSAFWR